MVAVVAVPGVAEAMGITDRQCPQVLPVMPRHANRGIQPFEMHWNPRAISGQARTMVGPF